jgi:hypothetical protein
MKSIKVLIIEHDDKRYVIKDIIERIVGENNVFLIDDYEIEKLKSTLQDNYFDFVFTDAFFLQKGLSHHYNRSEEKLLLKEIVTTIRESDKRVKIVVYTRFNDRLDEDQLSGVDYVLDKRVITADLFSWQLKRLIDRDLNANYEEHILISAILEFLKKEPQSIWGEDIVNMLKEYRNGINETDQINAIKVFVTRLATNCGFSSNATKMFEMLQLQEPLCNAGNPTKWGHLRHVINVYWLGYYIINNKLINIDTITCKLNKTFSNESDKLLEINKVWFICSIFHDIGNLGEMVDSLIEIINMALSIYPVDKENNSIQFKNKDFEFGDFDALCSLIAETDQSLYKLIKEKHTRLKPDHGILSAMTLFKELHSNETNNTWLALAIKAIALHNIFQKSFENVIRYNYKKEPILNLLILCDLLEIWDRSTGFETIYNELPIEKIELSNIAIMDNNLYMKINYRLHNSILPTDSLFKIAKTKLTDIIAKMVLPILDAIQKNDMLHLKLEFKLNERISIHKWPTNNL